MGLRDEMALYTELTGEDGTKVPIIALGHFLWGYEIGIDKGRPKGKWKHLGETIRAITLEMHQCSECGYVVLTRSEFNQESYCPNCGANMRGEE